MPKLIAVCVPLAQGSHRLDTDREVEIPAVGQPAGAIPVTCPRNSCMIFDRRLLHAASTNWCGMPSSCSLRTYFLPASSISFIFF